MRILQLTLLMALLASPAIATPGIPRTEGQVGVAVELVGTGLLDGLIDGIESNRTIRLVASLPAGWRLEAVAGNSEQDLVLECNNGTFFQSAFGGPTSTSINDAFFSFFPELEFDSFVTIGAVTANGVPYSSNELQDVGFAWHNFEVPGGYINENNGAWFITINDDQGEQMPFTDTCDNSRNGVTIAQLTLLGEDATVSFSGLLQVRDGLGETQQAFFSLFETLDGDRSPADIAQSCAADMNNDDRVNVDDLLTMLTNWRGDHCIVDLTFDDTVDANDIIDLITQWGPCPIE
jgi:hypothetical protein